MIRDLSESLEAFLNQPGLPPELASAVVRFDRPTEPFAPTETTLDLFLFDVRENTELRSNEPVNRRVGDQVFHDRPPARITCTYMLTAWPVGGLELAKQEHRLLSQTLQLLLSTPTIPAPFLVGSLVGQEPPLPLLTAQPDSIRDPSQFWGAVGGHIRASILLSVTFSMTFAEPDIFPMVISSGIRINSEPLFYRIGGVVQDAVGDPVASASVELLNAGRITATNVRGEFTLPAIAAGAYSLRATAGPLTRTRAITVPAALGDNYDVQLI